VGHVLSDERFVRTTEGFAREGEAGGVGRVSMHDRSGDLAFDELTVKVEQGEVFRLQIIERAGCSEQNGVGVGHAHTKVAVMAHRNGADTDEKMCAVDNSLSQRGVIHDSGTSHNVQSFVYASTRLLKYSQARFDTSSPETCGEIVSSSSGVK